MSNQQQTNMKEDQYKHKQQFSNVLNDIVFMTDFILTNEPERNSLSYCIIDHIKDHDPAVYKKDQVWYCEMKNALRHQGATAPPRPKKKEEEEDCIKVPDYDKHKLDKNCYICAVDHMKQKTPDSLYSQLTELTNGKYVCDGDECFNMMMEGCAPAGRPNNITLVL
tara:strand:+ start:326 stop:823 length:498 start_codon:yes stop_codon:yes gene_type:complete